MAAGAEFKVVLTIDSQGNAKIDEVKRGLEGIGETAAKSGQAGAAGADEFASALMRKLGVMALVTAGLWKLEQAAVGAFKAGIQAVDDYKVSVIGIAATLTDMAKADQGSIETVFLRNKVAAEDMYKGITIEAARHFSSAREGMMVYNRLVQSGYAVQKSELSALLLLSDKIKLATKGQNVEMQLNTEIIALMSGQARAQSMIAMELQSRLGSGWGELVKKHREAGDLLAWITTLFPGLVTANKEIEDTLNAQWATTKGLFDLLSIGGLSGAYQDIVGLVKDINKYLKDHGQELAGNIMTTWNAVKEVAGGVVTVVAEIVRWFKTGWGYLEGWRSSLSDIAKQRADMGVGMGLDVMPAVTEGFGTDSGLNTVANQEAIIAQVHRNNQTLADAADQYKNQTYKMHLADQGPVKTAPGKGGGAGKGGGGGGGKGAEAAERSLENFVSRMKQETAKAAGEGMAALDQWYAKESQTLDRLGAKGQETTAAKEAMDTAYWSKADKLSTGFYQLMGKESGNAYLEIDRQAQDWLTKFQGIKDQEGNIIDVAAQVAEAKARKTWELDVKNHTERLGLEKGYYDQAAQLSPLLSDQIGFKRKALELDIEAKRYAEALKLNKLELAGIISRTQADEYRGMQTILDQQKRYNFEMENSKGLAGWAYGRVKSESQKNTWADAMEGLESFVNDAWTQGVQGALSKTKVDYMEVAKTMAMSFILNLGKQGIHKIFTGAAEAIAGAGKLGTESNPMVVTIKGMGLLGIGKEAGTQAPDFAKKASKIGYSTGGNQSWAEQTRQLATYDKLLDKMYKDERKDLGGIQKLQDHYWKDLKKDATAYSRMQDELIGQNQELFKADYLDQYQTGFEGMVGNITSVWQVGQGLMTAAGVTGEAQRYGAMVSYGIQGISLLTQLAKGKILIDAAKAAAAGYSSVMEALPWPINIPVAIAWAALSFAGTMAAGAFHEGGMVGGLARDEHHIIAQTGEGIIKRDTMAEYARQGISFDMLNSGRLPVAPLPVVTGSGTSSGDHRQVNIQVGDIHINPPAGMTDREAKEMARRQIWPAIEHELRNRGLSLLG